MTNNDIKKGLEGLNVLDLRPCLRITATVSCKGGQRYERRDERALDPTKKGELRAEWTTKKVIDDEDEFGAATKLRRKCLYDLGKVGRHIPTGMIASLERGPELRAFRDEWRAKFQEFNSGSRYTKIRFDFWIERVQGENVDNLEQVLEELRDGLDEMAKAYQTADPGSLREAMKRMTGFNDLLPERVGMTLDGAIKAAKQRADRISSSEKRVQRAQQKIEEELGPEGNTEAELERLAAQPLTEEIRRRVKRVSRLSDEAESAVKRLEEAKRTIDDSPIQLARFAMRRRRPSVTEVNDAQQQVEELMSAELAARAGLVRSARPQFTRSGAQQLETPQ